MATRVGMFTPSVGLDAANASHPIQLSMDSVVCY